MLRLAAPAMQGSLEPHANAPAHLALGASMGLKRRTEVQILCAPGAVCSVGPSMTHAFPVVQGHRCPWQIPPDLCGLCTLPSTYRRPRVNMSSNAQGHGCWVLQPGETYTSRLHTGGFRVPHSGEPMWLAAPERLAAQLVPKMLCTAYTGSPGHCRRGHDQGGGRKTLGRPQAMGAACRNPTGPCHGLGLHS